MLRVGVIGCGSIAKQRHGYEYFHNSAVEIKGFYDLIPERAQALVDLYGGKVDALPLGGAKSPCLYCDFRAVCGHTDGENERTPNIPADPFE